MSNITIQDVTNGSAQSGNWLGTGVFDKLIEAVNKNIEIQYLNGRITGSDYANVYLGSMQAVLAQSVDFVLREKLTEAQIELAQAQKLSITIDDQLKQDKLADDLLTAAKQRDVLTSQKLTTDSEKLLKDQQRASMVIDDQLKQDKLEDDLLTAAKQRLVLDEEIELKDQQKTSMMIDDQLKQNKLTDDLLTASKQRQVLDGEIQLKAQKVITEGVQRDVLTSQELLYGIQGEAFKKKQNKELLEKVLDTNLMAAINSAEGDAQDFSNTTKMTTLYNAAVWV